MYNSKYYTCEQIDQRLLEGYYDDAVAAGYTGSKAQYLAGLLRAINYSANPTLTADKVVYDPAISGLTSKNVKAAIDELANKKADKAAVDAELAKKFDKESVVQSTGKSEDKVMSQKVVTDNLTELQNTVFPLEVSLSIDKPSETMADTSSTCLPLRNNFVSWLILSVLRIVQANL